MLSSFHCRGSSISYVTTCCGTCDLGGFGIWVKCVNCFPYKSCQSVVKSGLRKVMQSNLIWDYWPQRLFSTLPSEDYAKLLEVHRNRFHLAYALCDAFDV